MLSTDFEIDARGKRRDPKTKRFVKSPPKLPAATLSIFQEADRRVVLKTVDEIRGEVFSIRMERTRGALWLGFATGCLCSATVFFAAQAISHHAATAFVKGVELWFGVGRLP